MFSKIIFCFETLEVRQYYHDADRQQIRWITDTTDAEINESNTHIWNFFNKINPLLKLMTMIFDILPNKQEDLDKVSLIVRNNFLYPFN